MPGNGKWKSTVWYRQKLKGRWGNSVCAGDSQRQRRGKDTGIAVPPTFSRKRWNRPLLHLPREMKQFYLLISKAPCARYDQRQGKLWSRLPVPLLYYIKSHFLPFQSSNSYAYQNDKFHKHMNILLRRHIYLT